MALRTEKERKQIAQAVLDGMVLRGWSLRKACTEAGVLRQTFLDWCNKDKDLADRYTRAREELIEHIATDLLEIADTEPQKIIDDKGIVRIDSASVQKQRLQVDARKWLLACLAPKRYGDRIEVATDKQEAPSIDASKLPTDVLNQLMAAKKDPNA